MSLTAVSARQPTWPRHLSVLALALGLAWSGLPAPVLAQAATHQLNIPAQPLAQALLTLGEQSRVEMLFAHDLVQGRQAPAVHGQLTPEAALQQLLQGTGITFRREANSITLLPESSAQAVSLAPVLVQAAALSPTTEGTASYSAPAVSIGRDTQLAREIPQSLSVMTRQQLDDQNITDLDDAMRRVTGLTVETAGVGGAFASFVSRGHTLDTLQIDGMPTPAGKGDLSTGFGLAMYDRIEVLRGPAGLYQGNGEPGGSINLARKRPLPNFGGSVQVRAGSWNTYHATVDVSTPVNEANTVRTRVVADFQDSDSFVDRVHTRRPLFYGVVEADVAERTTVTAGVAYQRLRSSPFFGLPAYADGSLLDVDRSTNLSTDWTRIRETTLEVFAEARHRLEGDGEIKASVFHRDMDMPERVFTWPNASVNPVTGATNLITWRYVNHWKTTGADVHVARPFTLAGRTHRVLLGADTNHVDRTFEYGGGQILPTNINNPDLNPPEPDYVLTNGSRRKIDQQGLYGRINFAVTDQLQLVAGTRLSWWRQDAANNNSHFNDFSIAINREYRRWAPYAGVVLELSPQLSAYGSYTTVFQPQTATDAQGNSLKPREGAQVEVGVKGEFRDGAITAHAALFRLQDRNRAMTDPDNPLYSVAAGKVRSQGMEMEVSGELAPGWRLMAGYAYTQTKQLRAAPATQGLPFSTSTPRHALHLWTHYQLPADLLRGVSVGGGVRVSSGYHNRAASGVEWRQHGYAVAALQVGYQHDRHWSGTVTVDNLFDRVYYERVSGGTRQNYYGNPRSVTLNVRYGF